MVSIASGLIFTPLRPPPKSVAMLQTGSGEETSLRKHPADMSSLPWMNLFTLISYAPSSSVSSLPYYTTPLLSSTHVMDTLQPTSMHTNNLLTFIKWRLYLHFYFILLQGPWNPTTCACNAFSFSYNQYF